MTEPTTVKETYKFEYSKSYSDGEQYTDVKIFTVNSDEDTWDQTLTKFTMWLGSCYGYDLTRQVQIHGIPMDCYDHEAYLENQMKKEALAGFLDNAQAAQDCRGCALCE